MEKENYKAGYYDLSACGSGNQKNRRIKSKARRQQNKKLAQSQLDNM